MNKGLKKVIETSFLRLHEGSFIFAKVKTAPNLKNHFVVTQDEDEITVITKSENSGELDILEKSNERSLFEIKFSPDSPDVSGFLTAISAVLAKEDISISVISTFSKDYILVHKEDAQKALKLLSKLGFR